MILANNYFESWKYTYYLKFFDHYPPHVREFLKHHDHRYMLLFNLDKPDYKLFEETTKKSLY